MDGWGSLLPEVGGALLITLGAALLLVRGLPALSRSARARGRIEVLETRRVDPRKSLLLVRVGRRHLLLGAAEGRLATLCELDALDLHGGDLHGGDLHGCDPHGSDPLGADDVPIGERVPPGAEATWFARAVASPHRQAAAERGSARGRRLARQRSATGDES